MTDINETIDPAAANRAMMRRHKEGYEKGREDMKKEIANWVQEATRKYSAARLDSAVAGYINALSDVLTYLSECSHEEWHMGCCVGCGKREDI